MKSILTFFVLLTIPVLILSLRVEKSYRQQFKMLGDFNTNNFDIKLDYENFIDDFPNISVTTLPLSTIKAEYFALEGKINEAVELFYKGIKANPYIGRSEVRLSEIYLLNIQNKDSAIFYAEKAYNLRPLNSKHFLLYLKSLALKNDREKLDKSIQSINSLLNKVNLEDRYLPTAMFYYLSSVNQYRFKNKNKYDSIAKRALKLFPKHEKIKIAANFIIYGKDSVQKALELDQKAITEFDKKNYKESFNLYSQSVSYWPTHEYSLQRAGISAYLSQNYNKSTFYLEKLLEIDNPKDGISELYLYESYKKLNDSINTCKYYHKLLQINPKLIKKNTKECF